MTESFSWITLLLIVLFVVGCAIAYEYHTRKYVYLAFVTVMPDGSTLVIGANDMQLTLTDEQKVSFTLVARTKAGNPAPLDGLPSWVVSDPDVLSLEVSEDGYTATVAATGQLGTAQLSVTVDADMDEEEVREITGTCDIVVVAAEAHTIQLQPGEPESRF